MQREDLTVNLTVDMFLKSRCLALTVEQLEALSPEAPRVLLATGKLVGEGFDHPAGR